MTDEHKNLVNVIESISEQIQVLALNIAVAAAKISFKQKLSSDVNGKLSQLVNHATLAVKNMGQVLRAARSDKPKNDILRDNSTSVMDSALINDIESSLSTILSDSQKIMEMLEKVKQKTYNNLGG